MKEELQGKLVDAMEYDPLTGLFRWKDRHSNACKKGWFSGLTVEGRGNIRGFGARVKAHRLAWRIFYGNWPAGDIDHIDGNSGNNRIENLRDVLHAENMKNITRPQKNNKLGVLGVRKRPNGRYTAVIQIDGRQKALGTFSTSEEASAVYKAASAKRLHAKEIAGMLK